MKKINLWLLILCVLSGISGITYLVFDPVVRSIVLRKLTMSRNSETFELWEDPPISPHFKVYFWNLTNPVDFFDGKSLPKLNEIGPYTYRQKWLKQNISWYENGTISYRTRKIFTFSASESCSGCNDELDNVTTINVPAISAYHQNGDNWFKKVTLKGIIASFNHEMYTRRTVSELLWGHDEPLFHLAEKLSVTPPPFTKFGFFLTKNTSKEEELGLYTMYTGQGDPYKLANIAKFNGLEHLGRWNGSECDRVHGSDGASFNPYIQEQDTLWFFNDQLCRSMPLVFDQELTSQGMPCLRFKPREDVFMPKKFPEENACYQLDGHVVGDGLFDVTNCQFDAPIVLSWPHFLHAEEKYRNAVQGLSPTEKDHGFWFDIQPVTGTTLSAKARIQINIMVKQRGYTHLENVKSTVVPLLWFEEGIDELGEDIITVLKRAAVDPVTFRQYILYLFAVLILVELMLAFICVVRLCQSCRMDKMSGMIEQLPNGIGGGCVVSSDPEQADQPMLAADSTDTSRVTTATHSRNCSEGVKPAYIQGSTQGRDKLNLEDFSARLTQKLSVNQFQYRNVQDGGNDREEVRTAAQDNLAAMLPTAALLTADNQLHLHAKDCVSDESTDEFNDEMMSHDDDDDDLQSSDHSETEFEGANVALVNCKPRLTSVSSSVTS